jgi:hypothetical protein
VDGPLRRPPLNRRAAQPESVRADQPAVAADGPEELRSSLPPLDADSVRRRFCAGKVTTTKTNASPVWILELNESAHQLASRVEVLPLVAQAQRLTAGTLSLVVDRGPRPWFHRLLGVGRVVDSCFALEWAEKCACLIFQDENASEYRALDLTHPIEASQELRLRVAHGEPTPAPLDECMATERAFMAVREYLERGTRPDWLEYRYVP